MAARKGVFPQNLWKEGLSMCNGPLIDWNGDGRIDPSDIAISLAIAEEEDSDADEEEA